MSKRMAISLRRLVPLGSENRWSNLLASLMETDPAVARSLLTLPEGAVTVRREVTLSPEDRLDLYVDVDDQPCTAVEVKVLSGLGVRQLERYHAQLPPAVGRVVVFPRHLSVYVPPTSAWRTVTWEDWLEAFADSTHPWVSATAHAWLEHMTQALPQVDGATRWDDIPDGDSLSLALRTRMSWVFGQLSPPDAITHDLVTSSAGNSSVVRMYTPACAPGYTVMMEAEEKLRVSEFKKAGVTPLGPSVRLSLMLSDIDTSAEFDWDYLHRCWPLMDAAREDWVKNAPGLPTVHDRAGWKSIVEKGAPKYLGVGFGQRQIKHSRECLFGARFQLSNTVTLAEVVAPCRAPGTCSCRWRRWNHLATREAEPPGVCPTLCVGSRSRPAWKRPHVPARQPDRRLLADRPRSRRLV